MMPKSPEPIALLAAAVAVGQAVQVANGTLHPVAILWITIGFVFSFLAAFGLSLSRPHYRESIAWGVVGTALVLQLLQLFVNWPNAVPRLSQFPAPLPRWAGLAISVSLVGSVLSTSRLVERVRMPAMLAAFLVLGAVVIRSVPDPAIDVHVFQRDGIEALLRGVNPYAVTFPNIFRDTSLYGEGLVADGRLQFGFPYPPLSLLLALPGHLLGGDHRYSQLAAVALAAVLIARTRPGRLGEAIAALFLFTPRAMYVVEKGWTEPFPVLGMAATVYCACHSPRLLPYVLGLLLSTKQYLVFVVPAAALLLPQPLPSMRETVRLVGRVALTGVVVSLPLALWDIRAFWRDVVALQFRQPFRRDALSYPALQVALGGRQLPTTLAFVAALAGVGLGLWRLARSAAGFAATCAIAYLGFLVFNKQAFCNYYYFVIGTLCVASVAAFAHPSPSPSESSPSTQGVPEP